MRQIHDTAGIVIFENHCGEVFLYRGPDAPRAEGWALLAETNALFAVPPEIDPSVQEVCCGLQVSCSHPTGERADGPTRAVRFCLTLRSRSVYGLATLRRVGGWIPAGTTPEEWISPQACAALRALHPHVFRVALEEVAGVAREACTR